MSATTIRCGAETPNGPCTRKVAAGSACGFHPDSRNDTADTEPRPAELCGCEHPLPITDDHGEVRCVKCGHRPSTTEEENVTEETPKPPWNPFREEPYLERQAEKQHQAHERLFGDPEPEPEEPTKPQGSANGGEGEAEPGAVYEWTPHGRMRVYDLDDTDPTE